MRITLFDRNETLCAEWSKTFEGCDDVCVACCELKTLLPHDAIVSPGNSFGIMTGGLDLAIRDMLGYGIQDAIQNSILQRSETLSPGQAVLVHVNPGAHGAVIFAPTMYTPRPASILDICYAMIASVYAGALYGKNTMAIPGLGTGAGQVPFSEAAAAMRVGYDAAKSLIAGLGIQAHDHT